MNYSTKQLKPCPFCRQEAKEIQQEENGDIVHAVRCTNTMCIGYDIQPSYFNAADARNAWNRRANNG